MLPEDRIMTLASMHPMFQVPTSAITLHPIMFEKSMFTYSCACQADVAESKLPSRYWNLEVYARVPRLESTYVSICRLQPLYFVTCSFWRGHHCEDIWQVLKTSILNAAPRPPYKFLMSENSTDPRQRSHTSCSKVKSHWQDLSKRVRNVSAIK